MEKNKETIVTSKAKSNAVKINSNVPVTEQELDEIIWCSPIAKYNFVNVTLKHTSETTLHKKAKLFVRTMKEVFALVLLQKAGLYEKKYTIVTNKSMNEIMKIITDFQAKILHESNDHRFDIKF